LKTDYGSEFVAREYDLDDLLDEISSNSPAPGGGSVSALSGSFGAALISMVCNLSIGKKRYKEVEEELKGVLNEAQTLRKELLTLSKEDVEAFNEVMAAFKISDEEGKQQSLQAAHKRAAEVPLEVSGKCLRLMELAQICVLQGNKNCQTDSGVGALTAFSGLKGAALNVKINLKYIVDDDFKTRMDIKIGNIEKKADILLKNILGEIQRSFA
jgi:formiminotetrahydrofolate cyclodeaminase